MPDPIHLSPAKWLAAILVHGVGQIALIVAAILGLTAANAWSQTTSSTPQPTSTEVAPPPVGLAMALEKEELAPYDITVFPNGRGLPPGQGRVTQGRVLYANQCAACHGPSGTEGPAARLVGSDGFIGWDDPLRPLRIAKHPLLVQSVGARWPYATTLFDYIRRAMPYHAPKSLENDDIYALTAFLLYRNGLLDASAVINASTLPKVVMPAAAKTVMAH